MAERAQVLIEAVDKATDVLDRIERKMASVGAVADKLKGALGALGAVVSVGMFTKMVESTIEAGNELYELSLRSGVSVEALSGLKGVAKATGTDMDAVAGFVQKLNKNLLEYAETGGGKSATAFQKLGVTQKEAKVALSDMGAFLPEFARRLTDTGTAAEQVALAQGLMSKAGANALPFLHQLAEAGELQGRWTSEAARQAHEYEVNMRRLEASSNALKTQLTIALLPALTEITNEMIRGRKEGGLLAGVWEGLKATVQQLAGLTNEGQLDWINKTIADKNRERSDLETAAGSPARQGEAQKSRIAQRIASVNAELDELFAKRARIEGALDMLKEFREGAERKPNASITTIGGGGTSTDTKSQFDALLKSLEDQRIQIEERSKFQEVAFNIDKGYYGFLTGAQKDALLRAAAALDVSKESVQVQKEADSATKKYYDDLLKDSQRANDELEKQAQKWRDIADPIEPLRRDLKEVNDLYEEGRIGFETWAEATFKVQEKIDEVLNKNKETAKDTVDWGRQVGLTFTSAAEDAIRHWQGFDNLLKKLAIDLAQLGFRAFVTDPLGKAATDLFKQSGAGSSNPFGVLGGAVGAGFQKLIDAVMNPIPTTDIPDGLGYGTISDFIDESGVLGSFAKGTDYVPQTGLYQLHQGERVVPSAENASTGGDTYYIDARGNDPAVVDRIERSIRALDKSIEPRIRYQNAQSWR